jgi:hypothetical protein
MPREEADEKRPKSLGQSKNKDSSSHSGVDIQRSEALGSDVVLSEYDSDSCSDGRESGSLADSDSNCWKSKAWEMPVSGLHIDKELVKGHRQARNAERKGNTQSTHSYRVPRSPGDLPRLNNPLGEIDVLIRKAIEQTLDPKQSNKHLSPVQAALVPSSLVKDKSGDILQGGLQASHLAETEPGHSSNS